jgi:hypothetical protein
MSRLTTKEPFVAPEKALFRRLELVCCDDLSTVTEQILNYLIRGGMCWLRSYTANLWHKPAIRLLLRWQGNNASQ